MTSRNSSLSFLRRGPNMAVSSYRSLTIALLLFSLAAAAFGQAISDAGSVRVVDPNGFAIAGAQIAASNLSGSSRTNLISGDDGSFALNGLRGEVIVVVTADGFARSERRLILPADFGTEIALHPQAVAAEVMVAATFLAGTAASLDELPGAVERIDRQTLESSRILNFSEALRKISGVNVRDEEGFGLRPNIGIRGTNPTRSTKVLLLEDGLPLAYAPYGDNASYYHPPIERYSEIEVLKGSSQIVYGPQTVAGVINYITPNPTEKPTFGIKLIGGNRDYFNGSFTGSGTIKKTGIFGNYTRKQGDGARENLNSKLNDTSVKVAQSLNSSNALTLKFSHYGEDSNLTYSGLTEAEYSADPRQNPFRNDFFYGDRYGTSVSHTAVLSSSTSLTTNAYYSFFRRHWWRQSSNSGQRPNRLNVDPDCLSMADLNTTCGNEGRLRQYDTYGIAPQVTHQYNAGNEFRGELQGGLRFHWEKQHRRQLNGDTPNSRDGVLSELNVRSNFATSAFIQNRFVFGEFSVTPGLRFERIGIKRQNLLANPIAEGNTTVDEFIPGIGIAYSGLPRTTIFAGVHRGFSPPRAEDSITNSGVVVELDPERSWNYEAGVRTNPARGLSLEGTFFRLDYENQIVPASIAGGLGAVLTNGGKTLQQGLEFSGRLDTDAFLASRHNFFVRTAFTWLPIAEFKGTRFSSVTNSGILNSFCPASRRVSSIQCAIDGNRLPYTPETLLTTSFGYSHAKGFQALIENVYIGDQFGDDLNAFAPTANGQIGPIASQSYWNATANYTVERWKTTFFVTAKNLSDRTYIVDRSRGILPSGPRLVQTGVSIKF
jgi:Fe(3+) dicitrate transport protein